MERGYSGTTVGVVTQASDDWTKHVDFVMPVEQDAILFAKLAKCYF